MELILQQQLPHQQKAIDAIVDVFSGAYISAPTQFYTNPTFSLADTHIATNIKRLQSELPPEYHSNVPVSDSEYLNLDIKMETGTGKTYVYTKTMFELHKRYGFNKFIIAVPSLAIKAGTEQFLNEPYARRHFTDGCGYGTEIETLVLESPKNKKKGRSYFPSVVSEFVKGSCQNTKKIYVLLVNMQLLTKLRSSGSENSKLQEVGRGLRLPVDENGNRISNEEFTLNYIVDFTEADFAQKLVDQINGELPQTAIISEEKLNAVAKKIGKSSDDLFDELYDKRYIDRHLNIKPETRDLFFAEYPDFTAGLSAGKVKDRNKDKPKPVKIRKAVYNEIKELWETINHRYLLFYDNDLNDNLDDVVLKLFEKPGVFTDLVMRSDRDVVESNGAEMNVIRETGVQYVIRKTIPYNVFLKRISSATNLPIKVLHTALTKYAQKHGTEFTAHINENTVAGFCAEFSAWKNDNLQGRFRYERSKAPLGATALTYADGTVRSEISQGRIGTKIVPGTPSGKYLYDSYAYDSPLEKDNIIADIDEVIVYGKIPRASIAIPTITGGMYSPDFMYVVKHKNGHKELNIIVETKDVENKTDLRGTEKAKIECAKVFFNMLTADGYTVHFRDQLGNKQMAQIISEVMRGEN